MEKTNKKGVKKDSHKEIKSNEEKKKALDTILEALKKSDAFLVYVVNQKEDFTDSMVNLSNKHLFLFFNRMAEAFPVPWSMAVASQEALKLVGQIMKPEKGGKK